MGTEGIPEPKPGCTSTKRDKVDSGRDPWQPAACGAPVTPGTEVMQIVVESLKATVNPEQSRSKPSSYKDPTKDGSVDNWVVRMRMYLKSRQTPMPQKTRLG